VETVLPTSRKIPSLDDNLPKGVNKISSHPLKQRSIVSFEKHQTIPQEIDEIQTQANPTFQPFSIEDHDYTSNDSSPASLRELIAQSEIEFSNSTRRGDEGDKCKRTARKFESNIREGC